MGLILILGIGEVFIFLLIIIFGYALSSKCLSAVNDNIVVTKNHVGEIINKVVGLSSGVYIVFGDVIKVESFFLKYFSVDFYLCGIEFHYFV